MKIEILDCNYTFNGNCLLKFVYYYIDKDKQIRFMLEDGMTPYTLIPSMSTQEKQVCNLIKERLGMNPSVSDTGVFRSNREQIYVYTKLASSEYSALEQKFSFLIGIKGLRDPGVIYIHDLVQSKTDFYLAVTSISSFGISIVISLA